MHVQLPAAFNRDNVGIVLFIKIQTYNFCGIAIALFCAKINGSINGKRQYKTLVVVGMFTNDISPSCSSYRDGRFAV